MKKEEKDNLINKYAKYVVNSPEDPLGDVLENMLNEYDHRTLNSHTAELKKKIEGKRKEMSKRYYERNEEIAPKDVIDALDDILSELNHQ